MAEISIDEVNIPRECARGVIREVEREYFRKIELIADEILRKDDINVVLIAGPSGSGKTTTANLIADEIKKRGDDAPVISLDDFYRLENDENYPKKLNGEHDYESPLALDINLFTEITDKILKKEPFEVPKYDFKTSSRIAENIHRHQQYCQQQHYPQLGTESGRTQKIRQNNHAGEYRIAYKK